MASAFYITAKGVPVFCGDSLEACLAYARRMDTCSSLKIIRRTDGQLMAQRKPMSPSWRQDAARKLKSIHRTFSEDPADVVELTAD